MGSSTRKKTFTLERKGHTLRWVGMNLFMGCMTLELQLEYDTNRKSREYKQFQENTIFSSPRIIMLWYKSSIRLSSHELELKNRYLKVKESPFDERHFHPT
jgi:hypothetical protein